MVDGKKIESIKNLTLEADIKKREKLEVSLKKFQDSEVSFITAKKEVDESYKKLVEAANDFFDGEKLVEASGLIDRPSERKMIQEAIGIDSVEEGLNLKPHDDAFSSNEGRIEAEKDYRLILLLNEQIKDKYKRKTWGVRFNDFWGK